MIAALLLLLASQAAPVSGQTTVAVGDRLLADYSAAGASRMWGAYLYCSAPGHQRLLRRIDARFARIRYALVARFGRATVNEADARRQALFDADVEGVGFGIA